jgi:Protein of unknown function (DUF4232)
MRLLTASATLIAAASLSACGGSSSTPGTTAAATSTSGGPASSSSSTTATNQQTSSASGLNAIPRCRASGLSLSYLGQQGATGHGELGFALRNAGSTSCHTFGFPGVLFLGKTGQPLPTSSKWTTHDFFGTAPEISLTVAPHQTVSFRVGVTHGIVSSAGCTTAYQLQVIPPNDTATMRVAIPMGAYECRTATVSPLRPGTSAYP